MDSRRCDITTIYTFHEYTYYYIFHTKPGLSTGVSKSVYIAKLPVLDDGQTHNDGPAPTRCWRNGGEDHTRHPHVQEVKAANGRIRVPESHNYVDTE